MPESIFPSLFSAINNNSYMHFPILTISDSFNKRQEKRCEKVNEIVWLIL